MANAIANQSITNISFDTSAGNYTIGATNGKSLLLQNGGEIQILSTFSSTSTETINAPLVLEGASGTYTFANNAANGSGAGAATLMIGGGITGGAAGATVLTLSGSNTNNNTISGVIANGSATSLAISKSGAGEWVLSGANTYTGSTTITSGTLQVGVNQSGSTSGALGTGAGTLNMNGVSGTTATLDLAGHTLTVGALASTANNTGNVNIVTSSTGNGVLTVNEGSANDSSANNFYFTQGSGATLALVFSGNGANGFTSGNGNEFQISNASNNFSGGITITGTGSTAITSSQLTSAGGIAFTSGNAMVVRENTGSGDTLGTGTITFNNGILHLAGTTSTTDTNALSIGANGGAIRVEGNDFFSGNLSGSGLLVISDKAGQGLTFSGSNSGFSGTIAIDTANTGTVTLGGTVSGGILPSGSSSGIYEFYGAGTYVGTLQAVGTSSPTVYLGELVTGPVSGTLANANGTLQNPTASTTVTYSIGDSTSNTPNFAGVIKNGTGTVAVTMTGTDTQTFSGANTYTGATTINGGTLAISGSGTLGAVTAPLAMGGGKLDLGTTSQTVGAVTITAAAGSGNTIQNGSLTGTSYSASNTTGNAIVTANLLGSSVALTMNGAGGTLTLSGANTYTGATTVSAGTLQAGVASVAGTSGAFGLNSAVTVANTAGATLALNGYNTQIASLTGGGSSGGAVTLGSGTLTFAGTGITTSFSGVISGTGGLTMSATGTQTLVGANTYSGATTVNSGTLQAGVASVAGTSGAFGNNSAVSLANTAGATLALANFNTQVASLSGGGTTGGNVTLGSATLTLAGTGISTTYSGVISGTGGLTMSATGTQNLAGANTYTGSNVINSGTLQVGVNQNGTTSGALGTGVGTLTMNGTSTATATLDLDGHTLTTANLNGGTSSSSTYNTITSSAAGGVLTVNTGETSSASGMQYDLITGSLGLVIANSQIITTSTNQYLLSNTGNTFSGGLTAQGTGSLTTSSLTSAGSFTDNTGSGIRTNQAAALGTGTITLSNGQIYFTGGGSTTLTNPIYVTAAGGVLHNEVTAITTGLMFSGSLSSAAGALLLINEGASDGTSLSGSMANFNGTIAMGAAANDLYLSGSATGNSNTDLLFFGNPGAASTVEWNGTGSQILTFGEVSSVLGLTTNTTGTLTNGTASTTTTYSLGDSTSNTPNFAGVIKNGTGTAEVVAVTMATGSTDNQTLSGVNTYTGATTVNGGTLTITGSLASGSAVAVNNGGTLVAGSGGVIAGTVSVNGGGTLSGTGTVSGAVTVAGGTTASTEGTISLVGSPVGALTLSNASGLTLGSTTASNFSNLDFGVLNATSDSLSITHALTVNLGGADITITNLGGLSSGNTYTLATFASGTGSGFATGSGTTVGDLTLTNPNLIFGVSGSLTVTSTAIELVTSGAGAPGNAYWSGAQGTTWASNNGTQGNFTTALDGGTYISSLPGSTTAVTFSDNGATNLTNTLGGNFDIASLTFLGTTNHNSAVTVNADGNTLTLESGGLTLNSGAGAVTIASKVALNASQTWANASSNNLTVSGVISGNATGYGLTINNTSTGSTILSGANTYSGGTTLTAGTLQLGNASALGSTSGALAVNGGTLDLNNNSVTVGTLSGTGSGAAITNTATGTATLTESNSSTTTYAGALNNGGTGDILALIKGGAGQLVLNGAGTYSGGTTVNAGSVQIGSGTALGTGTVTLTAASTTLDLNGQTISNVINLANTGSFNNTGVGGNGALINSNTSTAAVVNGNLIQGTYSVGGAGNITLTSINIADLGNGGSGNPMTKVGTGTLTLAGTTLNYNLSVTVNGGTLILDKTGGNWAIDKGLTIGSGAKVQIASSSEQIEEGQTVANSGTFDLNGFSTPIAMMTGSGVVTNTSSSTAATLILGASQFGSAIPGGTFAGTLQNGNSPLAFTQEGTGSTVILSGANTYTGATTVSAGILQAGVASVAGTSGAFGNNSAVTTSNVSGATLALNNFNTQIGSLAGGGSTGGNVTLGSATLTIAGSGIATSYGGVISGTGGLTLNATGTQTLTGASTYNGATAIGSGATLQLGNGTSGNDGTIASSSGITDNGTLIYDYFGNLSSGVAIGGSGAVTVNGPGSETLTATNTYNGATTISSGATLQLGDGTSGHDGTIASSSGITDNGTLIYDRYGSLSSGVAISGSGAVTKTGTGTQTLTAAESYQGTTTISSGTLALGSGGVIYNGVTAGPVVVNGTFDISQSASQTIGDLSGSGVVYLGGYQLTLNDGTTQTFSGAIKDGGLGSGTGGSLAVNGNGLGNTLTLSGSNTFTGATTITNDAIVQYQNGALGSSSISVDGGSTVQLNGVSGGSSSQTFTVTAAGTGADGASLEAVGSSGSNTFGDAISLTGTADVEADSGSTLSLTGNISNTATSTLKLIGASTGTNTLSGIISDGSGKTSLTESSSGTWLLTNANTFSGATSITSGKLQLGNANALQDSAVTISTANGLTFNNSVSGGTTYNVASLAGTVAETLTDVGGNAVTVSAGNNTGTTYSGVLSGLGGLTKVGTGTMVLSGSTGNSYTGLTTVSGGQLNLDKTGSGANAIAINGNATISGGTLDLLLSNEIDTGANLTVTSGTLNFNNKNQTINSLSVSGGLVQYGTGTVTISDPSWSGGTNTITGTTSFGSLDISGGTNTISSGSLTVGGDATGTGLTLSGTGTFTAITDNSALDLSSSSVTGINTTTNSGASIAGLTGSGAADIAGSGSFNLGGITQTVDVAYSGTSVEIDPVISNGGINKTGAGSLIVTNNNTYGGGTTVNAGTFYANNSTSSTGSGAVQVNSGGTLAGSGTVAGAVTVNTTSTTATLSSGALQTPYAYGNTPGGAVVNGTGLTLSSTLSVNGGSTLAFALGSNIDGNGGFSFTNPNMDSTYLTVSGSGDIFSDTTTAAKDNIMLTDLTYGAPSGTVTLTLRYQGAYELIGAASGDFSNLYTTGSGNTGTGYVLGVDNGSGGYTPFNIEVLNPNGTQINTGTNYQGLQLYLDAGLNGQDVLEVVPEPGTWALMLGGLALLVFIQRRRSKLN